MANETGSFNTSKSAVLYVTFNWSVTYDTVNMKANWVISAYVLRGTSGSYSNNFVTAVKGSPNSIKFGSTTVWSGTSGGSGTQANPVHCYTSIYSICADKTSPQKYTSGEVANKYVYGYAHLLTNRTFTTNLDSEGKTSLTVTAQFQGGYTGNISSITFTIIPETKADIGSKIGKKDSGSWTDTGRIWHKENGTWVKRNLYRKQSDTSGDWVKI